MSAEREAVDEDEPVVRPERPPAPAPKSVSFFVLHQSVFQREGVGGTDREGG